MTCDTAFTVDRWWIVHTRPLYEDRLARELDAFGASYYLPKVPIIRKHYRRGVEHRDTAFVPALPRCLFLSGDWRARDFAARSRAISGHGIQDVIDQRGFAMDLERFKLRVAEQGARPLLKAGAAMRVASGPFIGRDVKIDSDSGAEFVKVIMDFMGRWMPASFRYEELEYLN